jgi:predicted Zn-dependent protease with MMP-like domain
MTAGWRRTCAPSLAEFDALARAAYEGLPREFRTMCGNVVVHVADFADRAQLRAVGLSDPFELLGLYEGVDLTRASVTYPAATPTHIHLFRRPILNEWMRRGDIALGDLIAHVLVHEIGHHFGLSDEAMHRIEDEAE